ncbi:hypothetical protein HDV57DRAFT_502313 [Trichoderma longibrachiatum]
MGERTGPRVFHYLWSYVLEVGLHEYIFRYSNSTESSHLWGNYSPLLQTTAWTATKSSACADVDVSAMAVLGRNLGLTQDKTAPKPGSNQPLG